MPKHKTIYHKNKDEENSVYMYYNDTWNIKLFDICDFENKEEWSIFLKCGQQPKE